MPSSTVNLPASDSPHLRLIQANEDEKTSTWILNGQVWRGRLSLPAYLRREVHLASQPFTRDGGITYWILVDTSPASSLRNRTILASCETLRKRALVAREGQPVQEVISHGIGSVFCDPAFRGKGYARRMLSELGKILDTWQQQDENKADFTVLFSDIGKNFYSKLGWKAFPSSHIALPPQFAEDDMFKPIPRTTEILADDLAELCKLDEEYIRAELSSPSWGPPKFRVALMPDAQTLQWHHAREEFAAKELFDREPKVKGAMAKSDTPGERVWCIWTRTYGTEDAGNTLNILRLVIEGEEDFRKQTAEADKDNTSIASQLRKKTEATALVLRAAQHEAAKWGMKDVQIWNPSELCIVAVQQIEPNAKVIHRDEDSIASLRWHGADLGDGVEVDWVGNEKYGWC